MNDTERWLERYSSHRKNLAWPWLYWTAVPLVLFGTVGLLWSLPIPSAFADISPFLNWGSAFLMAAAVYYFILSLAIAIGLLPFIVGIAAVETWLAQSGFSPLRVSAGLLVAGLIGLWLGHRRKPGVSPLFEDLQTIMIGPVWAMSVIYRRLGIPY